MPGLEAINSVKFAISDDSMSVNNFNLLANNISNSLYVWTKRSRNVTPQDGRQGGRDFCRTTAIDVYGRLLTGNSYCKIRKIVLLFLQVKILKIFIRM